jgi:hypothetical protein
VRYYTPILSRAGGEISKNAIANRYGRGWEGRDYGTKSVIAEDVVGCRRAAEITGHQVGRGSAGWEMTGRLRTKN